MTSYFLFVFEFYIDVRFEIILNAVKILVSIVYHLKGNIAPIYTVYEEWN